MNKTKQKKKTRAEIAIPVQKNKNKVFWLVVAWIAAKQTKKTHSFCQRRKSFLRKKKGEVKCSTTAPPKASLHLGRGARKKKKRRGQKLKKKEKLTSFFSLFQSENLKGTESQKKNNSKKKTPKTPLFVYPEKRKLMRKKK